MPFLDRQYKLFQFLTNRRNYDIFISPYTLYLARLTSPRENTLARGEGLVSFREMALRQLLGIAAARVPGLVWIVRSLVSTREVLQKLHALPELSRLPVNLTT